MQKSKRQNGFTLAELIIALVVTAIIMSAVTTLTFALGDVNEKSSQSFQEQAHLRYTMLRLPELIKNAKLIIATPGDDIVIWKADNNPANGMIDILEIAYIEAGVNRNYIKLLEFTNCSETTESQFQANVSPIAYLDQGANKNALKIKCDYSQISLIPECSNVSFVFDEAAPWTKFVSISFNLHEGNEINNYQINMSLRSWAGYLLNSDGTDIVSNDEVTEPVLSVMTISY